MLEIESCLLLLYSIEEIKRNGKELEWIPTTLSQPSIYHKPKKDKKKFLFSIILRKKLNYCRILPSLLTAQTLKQLDQQEQVI